MPFLGVDWAEQDHHVCVMGPEGLVYAKRRVPNAVGGIGELHALVAEHADEDHQEVVVGIQVDRGLLVGSLVDAGYEVFAVNPMAVARYRDRHATSGAKSDAGDAKVLADLVRTDRHTVFSRSDGHLIAGFTEASQGEPPTWSGTAFGPTWL